MSIVTRLVFLGSACAILSACSSEMTRFDVPIMGMNGDPAAKKQYADSGNQYKYNAQGDYQKPYDGSQYQAKREYTNRDYTSRDYSQNDRASYQDPYQPKKLYKQSYETRDVYNTASTDKAKQRYTNNYQDGRDDFGRNQLPELNRQNPYADNAKIDQYSAAPKKQSYAANMAKRDPQGRHIVSQGDTLYNISKRYRVTPEQVRRSNEMVSNDIQLGQHLYIPGLSQGAVTKTPKTTAALKHSNFGARKHHLVEKGDTAYNISRRYGVSTQELAQANDMSDLSQVKLGQQLVIPKSGYGQSIKKRPVRVASIDKKSGLKNIKLQNVPPPNKKPFAKRSYKKAAKIKSIDSGARAKLASNHSFVWPANGKIISSFGRQKSGTINDGVNLALPAGTKIKAAEGGVVAYAGSELKGYGNLILIRHDNNWVTAYAHNSKLLVKRGQKVRRGQAIAKSGKSGSVHQPQLHFELRKGSKPVNPMKYLAMR